MSAGLGSVRARRLARHFSRLLTRFKRFLPADIRFSLVGLSLFLAVLAWGGLNALICDDGVIRRPAMSDKTGMYFDMHPDTCTPFINFRVPYFDEAIALCKKAAKVRPDMRYVGWDVGITPTGPVLVEGNNLPAYDGQIYHQQENPGTGLRPLVRSIIPEF